ncbi:MAG: hypothetical protein Ct9H300mP28_14440 [Pseudomonadota bacterium]|nr:MAG: hypothetical protein Ct9H300mP28_14440 [Pseudomonadota bacterium]
MKSGERGFDSRTGRSLTKYYQLLTDPKEYYLKAFIPEIVMNNQIYNTFSTVNN